MNHPVVALPVSVPAPMSQELETELTIRTNRLDPEGTRFSIAFEDAPSKPTREALARRVQRLDGCLAAIGERGAASQVMALSLLLKSRGKSAKEAEATLDLYVENLAGLPGFAVVSACEDYLQGRAGDRKWMPELPELRAHAVSKMRTVAAERQRIQNVLKARVRAPRATPEQRAATVAMARDVAARITLAGRRAEAERAGVAFDPEADAAMVETAEEALARLARQAVDDPVTLSPALRRRELIRRGIDVDALDEAAETQRRFDDQGHAE